MKRILFRSAALTTILTVASWAGALVLQVGNPDANPEAKKMNALLVADSTACHEPAKSLISASFVQMDHGKLQRTQLQIAKLAKEGTFAVIGSVPAGSVIEISLTNPVYKNYQPRVLLHRGGSGVDWASARRFYSVPPTDTDVKNMLDAPVD